MNQFAIASEGLRYPIGHLLRPEITSRDLRAAHIETLRQLPAVMGAASAGLSDTQLDTPYREGGWTVRQVVHHVADSTPMLMFAVNWRSPRNGR